jgi:TolB-like protein
MSFFAELKRRNVFRVGAAYAVLGWLLIEVASVLLPTFEAPTWVQKTFTLIVLLGWPVALFLAWAFELTPEGVKLEKDVDRNQSITNKTGRKLDFIIIGFLIIALAYFIWESRSAPPEETIAEVPVAAIGKSIAVLPFSNLSPDSDTDYFVAGLHDDLLTQLSKIHDLKVISRTSVLEYAGTTQNMREIGEALGVATIMEGGVQRSGDRVRLNVQLIGASNDEHLWAETYDRTLSAENVFDIQSEITRQIVRALSAVLTESEESRLEDRPTDNLVAYESYLNASLILDKVGTGDFDLLDQALAAAEQSVQLDPEFVEAWATLGEIYLHRFWYEGRDPESAGNAKQAIDAALAIDPSSPEARTQLGWYHYWVHFDYPTAIPEFKRALEMQPGSSNTWDGLASAYRRSGQFELALQGFEQSRLLSPQITNAYIEVITTLTFRHHLDASDRLLKMAEKRFPGSIRIAEERGYLELLKSGSVEALHDGFSRAVDDVNASARFRFDYVMTLSMSQKVPEALAYLEEWSPGVIDVQYEYWPQALLQAHLLRLEGEADQSRELAESVLPGIEEGLAREPDNAEMEKARGIALALSGKTDAAMKSARRVRTLYPPTHDAFGSYEYQEDSIMIAAMVGEFDTAFAWLDDYLGSELFRSLRALAADPAFAALFQHADMQQRIDQFGWVPEDRGPISFQAP